MTHGVDLSFDLAKKIAEDFQNISFHVVLFQGEHVLTIQQVYTNTNGKAIVSAYVAMPNVGMDHVDVIPSETIQGGVDFGIIKLLNTAKQQNVTSKGIETLATVDLSNKFWIHALQETGFDVISKIS